MKLPRTLRIPRQPDFIIGKPDAPYMLRWWVIPKNRFFNIYLHKILRDDDDRALHDHPWASCSIILKGGYIEHTPAGAFVRRMGWVRFRRASASHRLQLRDDYSNSYWAKNEAQIGHTIGGSVWTVPRKPAWTIFITGPKVREWGFHCPKGWMHWRQFIGVPAGEAKGDETNAGCGD